MLTVNGKAWELNIGCRTFISVSELFEHFGVAASKIRKIVLDGRGVDSSEFPHTPVSNNSVLLLEGVELKLNGLSPRTGGRCVKRKKSES